MVEKTLLDTGQFLLCDTPNFNPAESSFMETSGHFNLFLCFYSLCHSNAVSAAQSFLRRAACPLYKCTMTLFDKFFSTVSRTWIKYWDEPVLRERWRAS